VEDDVRAGKDAHVDVEAFAVQGHRSPGGHDKGAVVCQAERQQDPLAEVDDHPGGFCRHDGPGCFAGNDVAVLLLFLERGLSDELPFALGDEFHVRRDEELELAHWSMFCPEIRFAVYGGSPGPQPCRVIAARKSTAPARLAAVCRWRPIRRFRLTGEGIIL
jgi:hypothetical protein